MANNQGRAGTKERNLTDDMVMESTNSMGTTRSTSTAQVMSPVADRVRWGPIWAGLLAMFFTLFVLSLLGLVIGASTVNAGQATQSGTNQNVGQYSAIWAGVTAVIAFLVGGYIAGRTAVVRERGWAALNGALVFLLALPVLMWLASQGLGAIIGNANNIAGGLGVNLGQISNSATGTVKNITPAQAQLAADTARNTAAGTLVGLLLGCAAAAIGGMMGATQGARGAELRNSRV